MFASFGFHVLLFFQHLFSADLAILTLSHRIQYLLTCLLRLSVLEIINTHFKVQTLPVILYLENTDLRVVFLAGVRCSFLRFLLHLSLTHMKATYVSGPDNIVFACLAEEKLDQVDPIKIL
jgi:hypothetical protein